MLFPERFELSHPMILRRSCKCTRWRSASSQAVLSQGWFNWRRSRSAEYDKDWSKQGRVESVGWGRCSPYVPCHVVGGFDCSQLLVLEIWESFSYSWSLIYDTNFRRVAPYVSMMMVTGGGVGGDQSLCSSSSLFDNSASRSLLLFVVVIVPTDRVRYCLVWFGCTNYVTNRGTDTVCQSKGCIFRHLVVFLGKKIYPVYNFGLYFQTSYHGFRWYWATQIYTAYCAVKVQYR
jgi:hypothetical protein